MSGKYLTEEEVEKASGIIKHAMRHQMSSYIRQTLSESLSILTAKESETAGTDESCKGIPEKCRSCEARFKWIESMGRMSNSIRAEAAQEAREEERKKCADIAIKHLCERCPVAFDCHGSCGEKNALRTAIAGKEEVEK